MAKLVIEIYTYAGKTIRFKNSRSGVAAFS
jgi:hypothetical protein